MSDMSDGLTDNRVGALLPGDGALVAILLGLAGGAWLLSARLATPDMRLGVLTGASPMPARGQMGMSDTMSGSATMGPGVFIATWTVMMVAMMVPSLVPAVRAFVGGTRTAWRRSKAAALFIAGYLLVWSVVGAVAYLVVQALDSGLAGGGTASLRVGAALLVAAGVYQLTPLQQTCLRHCRSPRAAVAPWVSIRARASLGTVYTGLWQGIYCLGSSWPLMLVLLLVGMMNLAWMGVVAGFIFVEKVLPNGDVFGKVVGWGLAGWGLILLAAPHALPA